jgi:RNA 2',3'-cyclic 3'-phosphodiesterase
MARLFFAAWPGARAAQALAEVARTLADLTQGKAVPPEKIHLTLAFLGQVTDEDAARASEAAKRLRSPAFAMTLDGVGSFRGARVAWAGCSRMPPGLEALQSSLAGELARRALSLEDRPFVPHVTLARRIAKAVPPAPMPPIEWQADELTLVRSETGTGRYTVLERWGLG